MILGDACNLFERFDLSLYFLNAASKSCRIGKQKSKVEIKLAKQSFDQEGSLLDGDQEAFRRIRRLSQRYDLTRDLRFMAEYKYDSYEVYSTSRRFLPSLLEWLGQFHSQREIETALTIVHKLLFLSRKEMLELSRLVYQNILFEIMNEIIRVHNLRRFDYGTAYRYLDRFLEKCVFIGMSDGAQTDYFRRHSDGKIKNDQVLPYYKIDEEEKRLHSNAKYAFLLDDMCGSGVTFLRVKSIGNRTVVEGQLPRFIKKWSPFATSLEAIYFCPYLITEKGFKRLTKLAPKVPISQAQRFRFKILYGMIIPEKYSILRKDNELFSRIECERMKDLCKRYYDPAVEDEHTRKGGGCKFGFGRIGIFLVRYNNTPNNTPSIIWHANRVKEQPALFRRLARHHL